jgi:tetratricopeptide (TPR) repeat protein
VDTFGLVSTGRKHRRTLLIAGLLVVNLAGSLMGPGSAGAQSKEPLTPSERIELLEETVGRLDRENERILWPVTILVGVLAAGGLIGIVFSFRDQRKASQIHELAVTGETSAQRRAEETYTSFFEASQKTLNLVNETLGLAKEATQRSAQETRRNAERERDEIDEKAEELLRPIFSDRVFEKVITVDKHRVDLERLAGELQTVEGYLRLQDIEILPHSRFVKGIAEYLDGRTRMAAKTLHRAARDATQVDLSLFSLYWAATLESHLGDYQRALDTFRMARSDITPSTDEWFEVERALAETGFFEKAREAGDPADPRERLDAVSPLLRQLTDLDQAARKERDDRRSQSDRREMKEDLIHEIAATLGDVYTWIAHDPKRVYFVLEPERDAPRSDPDPAGLEGDDLRRWALRQAKATYHAAGKLQLTSGEEGSDFEIEFGLAHCDFALQDRANLYEELAVVEKLARDRPEVHLEPRKRVEFAQTTLICKCWRLALVADEAARATKAARAAEAVEPPTEQEVVDDGAESIPRDFARERRDARAEVANAYERAMTALQQLEDYEVELFSEIRRRNVNRGQFREELDDLKEMADAGT